jgi:hypothetical protein
MKIGVMSDSHDRADMVIEAIRLLRERSVEMILHCGDIQQPSIVRLFSGIPARFVLGNWDRDKIGLGTAVEGIGGHLDDEFGEIELCGRKLAWTHGHHVRLLQDLERYDLYDYVFHGHTHRVRQERIGKTWVVNPGALYRCLKKTCVVVDLPAGEIEYITVETQPRGRRS